MNQIKRKRRLTAIEAAVLGNILYLIIVIIFKSVFNIVGRTSGFNYLFNGIELAVVGLFWIILFARSFKNIYAGEKPRYIKYIFFTLIPIIILTVALTLVSMLWPGQDTNSIWNQFTFLAAPTIFWYLPYGLIYQLIGHYVSIYVFFGIALGVTVLFQMIGIVAGQRMGKKYREETRAEEAEEKLNVSKSQKTKRRWDGKGKKPQNVSIGMERLSEEMVSEGFKPGEQNSMMMTEVMIKDAPQQEDSVISKIFDEEIAKPEANKSGSVSIKKTINQEDKSQSVELSSTQKVAFENQPTAETVEHSANQEVTGETTILEKTLSVEWKLTHPDDEEKIEEEKPSPKETGDKSFLKETSQIRIINEDDIEEYYRNKK
ncbi:MAG: UbiA prenyltransferase family protein [Eubacteriaceae bacterium]|nr:UbiA prenyltransferase family protein [Eubacteriaceae bacterium]